MKLETLPVFQGKMAMEVMGIGQRQENLRAGQI